MIRIYLRLAIPLLAIFIALNIAARALGSTQPPNPALRGFTEGCEHTYKPCWYGIVTGETSLMDAQRIAKVLGYQNGRKILPLGWHYDAPEDSEVEGLGLGIDEKNTINTISLTFKDVSIGDFFIFLGFPDGVSEDFGLMKHYRGGYFQIFFNAQLKRVSPYSFVDSGFIANETYDFYHLWYGFLPLSRYCELQKNYHYCN